MYRIVILTAVCLSLALAAATGCKGQTEQMPAAGQEQATTAPSTHTIEDVQQQAIRAEAQAAYLDGVRARQAGDLKAARDAFARAVQLDPQYTEAAKALDDAKIALGEATPAEAQAAAGAEKLAAQMQQARQEVRTNIAQARAQFQKEQFQEAIDSLTEALGLMDWATKAWNMDFSSERPEAQELLQNAQVQQGVFAQAQDAERRKAAQIAIEDKLRAEAESRKEKADALLATARQELARKNFTQAANYARHAVEADPGNAEAMEMASMINQQRINYEHERIILQKEISWRENFINIEEAGIPKAERPMNWPDKEWWVAMTERRLQRSEQEQKVFQRTAEQEKIGKILDETKVRSLNIEDQAFPSAVTTLRKQFKNAVPIVLHPDVMTALSTFNVSVVRNTEMTLRGALELLISRVPKTTADLSYVIKDEAVLITLKGAEENKSLIIYPVQDLLRKQVNFKPISIQINRDDLFQTTTTGTGTTTSSTTEQQYFQQVNDPTVNGVEDFWDTNLEGGLRDLIVNTCAENPDNWNVGGETPGAPASIDFRKGNMYINSTEVVHGQIQNILKHLRYTNEVLVTLEARFLQVQENLLEEIGVDLTGYPTPLQQAQADAQGLNFTDKFLEGILTDVNASPHSGVFFAKRGSGIGFVPTGTDGSGQLVYLENGVPNGDALGLDSQNILDANLSSALSTASNGLTAGFALTPGSGNMNFVIKALENSSRSTTLAAPKITTYNLQPAYIAIVKEQTFIGSVTDAQVNTTDPASVDPIPSILPSGIVLKVLPTVTWDRKYVILEVLAYSTIGTLPADKHQTLDLTPPANSQNGTVIVEQPKLLVEFDFPVIDTQNVLTTVVIPDGGTVILGGLSQMDKISGGATTPLLGDIPIVKFFFTKKGNTATRSSLVILLRADITVVPDAEERFLEEN